MKHFIFIILYFSFAGCAKSVSEPALTLKVGIEEQVDSRVVGVEMFIETAGGHSEAKRIVAIANLPDRHTGFKIRGTNGDETGRIVLDESRFPICEITINVNFSMLIKSADSRIQFIGSDHFGPFTGSRKFAFKIL